MEKYFYMDKVKINGGPFKGLTGQVRHAAFTEDTERYVVDLGSTTALIPAAYLEKITCISAKDFVAVARLTQTYTGGVWIATLTLPKLLKWLCAKFGG